MNFLDRIRNVLTRARPKPLDQWFFASFDEQAVRLRAEPPGEQPWSQEFAWNTIIRICFKAEDMCVSDGIYVFTSQRPESYVIPTEASGGDELWKEILRRGLFDSQLAIDAVLSMGGIFCWPPEERR